MKKYKWFTLISIFSVMLVGCANFLMKDLSEDMMLANQGLQEISKENYIRAEIYLKRALKLNPNNPYALLNMGVLYQNMGQPEKARHMYKRLITLNPKEVAGHSNQDSGVGKTLVDIAGDNMKLLERQKPKTIVSTEKPAQETSPNSFAQEKKKSESGENFYGVTGNATSEEKAVSPSPRVDQPGKKMAWKMKEGYYNVRKGDTLFKIAGRKDVYEDPLEWPGLYWLNIDQLGGMRAVEDFQHKEIREGLILKFVTSPITAENRTHEKTKSEREGKFSGVKRRVTSEERSFRPAQNFDQLKKRLEAKQEEGHYRVRKGDTLFIIAGRKDVYGDTLKWPSLFRLNVDKLGRIRVVEDFQHKELNRGLDLKFMTSRQALENLNNLGRDRWAVNVLSALAPKTIVQPAIRLMKNGYHVYITKAKVKGRDWMRFRVGFFRDNSEAVTAGKKIRSMLNNNNGLWVVKVPEGELKRFGGY